MTNFVTNVPVPVLTSTGYSIPSESQVLVGVIMDMQSAFGGTLNLSATNTSSLSTPQGQLATSLAACISDCYAQLLALSSQVDPQYAQGLMQDAIGNIYGMQRYPATGTQVPGTATGLPGTIIPLGVPVATDAGNNVYTCATSTGTLVTIGSGGTASVVFTNMQTGPIVFGGGMVISQITPGWDSIATTTPVVLGSNIESTQQFETRRQLSVAINANGISASIRAAILSLTPTTIPGSAYVVDNPSNAAMTVGGVVLPPNSVYVAAYNFLPFAVWTGVQVINNGAPTTVYPIQSVAQAIFAKKSLGCTYAPSCIFNGTVTGGAPTTLTVNSTSSGQVAIGQTLLNPALNGTPYMNGTTPVMIVGGSGSSWTLNLSPGTITAAPCWTGTTNTVLDPNYPIPQPAYNVTFTVPVQVPINIQVTLAAAANPPVNAAAILQSSTGLPTAFNGTDGYPAVSQIGATVYGSRFYTTIAQAIPGCSIIGVVVSSSSITPGATTPVLQGININQIPIIGTVTVITQ